MAAPGFIVSVGSAGATNTCVPDAELWVTPASSPLSIWYYAGNCPQAGQVICANAVLATGRTITFTLRQQAGGTPEMDAICFQDQRMLSGVDPVAPGGAASSTGTAFEYTPEQQAEVYTAMAAVFGLFLGAMSLVWVFKQLIRIFTHNGASE